jgi:hypothetical protein
MNEPLTPAESEARADRRREYLATMTRAKAHAALDAYHIALRACQSYTGAPDSEKRDALAFTLNTTRRELDACASVKWAEDER